MRTPQIQTHEVERIQGDGFGNLTVYIVGGAHFTVCDGDLPRAPKTGDMIRVQLPIAVGFAPDNAALSSEQSEPGAADGYTNPEQGEY